MDLTSRPKGTRRRARTPARRSMLADANFRRWFGESKVVDARGRPLVVYHQTQEDFSVFDTKTSEMGAHFGYADQLVESDRRIAAYLRINNPLRLRDPGYWSTDFVLDKLIDTGIATSEEVGRRFGRDYWDKHPSVVAVQDFIREKGYDGIVYLNRYEGIDDEEVDDDLLHTASDAEFKKHLPRAKDAWIVFDPTQIKSATANDGNFDPSDPDIRRNPMRFVIAYEPEQAEELKWSRAARSIISPALQRKNVERMANSPHNFVVMLRGGYHPVHRGWLAKPPVFADAVTLVVSVSFAAEEDEESSGAGRANRESLYTAFTYLHKFGDAMVEAILGTGAISGEDNLLAPRKRFEDNDYPMFYEMFDEHMALLEKVYSNRRNAYNAYTAFLQHAVNSKMVREGYSVNWTQALADLFPLCELTPPSRPLLLPVEAEKAGLPPRAATVFNESILPDFNVRFRAFYNDLVPRLYGEVVEV